LIEIFVYIRTFKKKFKKQYGNGVLLQNTTDCLLISTTALADL